MADALAKKGASVFLAANEWVKLLSNSASMPPVYLLLRLLHEVSLLTLRMFLLAARRIWKRERTILEIASTHSLVPVGNEYHCCV